METLKHRGPLVVIVMGALALAAIGGLVFAMAASGSSAPQASDADQLRADMALIRSEIQALRKDVRDLRARAEATEKKVASLPSTDPRVRPLLSEQDRTLAPPPVAAAPSAAAPGSTTAPVPAPTK